MQFDVLKPFTWAGQELKVGDKVEIPDESPKIGPLARAKFIRHVGEALPGKVEQELPKVEEVAQEIKAEEQPPTVATESSSGGTTATRDPKDIIRLAKAKAAAKK